MNLWFLYKIIIYNKNPCNPLVWQGFTWVSRAICKDEICWYDWGLRVLFCDCLLSGNSLGQSNPVHHSQTHFHTTFTWLLCDIRGANTLVTHYIFMPHIVGTNDAYITRVLMDRFHVAYCHRLHGEIVERCFCLQTPELKWFVYSDKNIRNPELIHSSESIWMILIKSFPDF